MSIVPDRLMSIIHKRKIRMFAGVDKLESVERSDPLIRPDFSETDNTPDKLRKAYGIYNIPVVGQRTKVAIISSFKILEEQINSDVAIWCDEFNIPPVKINVVNKGALISDADWYLETVMDVKAIISMNPNADIYVITRPTASRGFTSSAILDAINMGINIVSMSFGSYEITRLDYLEKFLSNYPDLICCASAGNDKILAYPGTSEFVFSIGASSVSVNNTTNTITEKALSWSSCGPTVGTPIPLYQTNIPLLRDFFKAKRKFGPDFCMNGEQFPVYDGTVINGETRGWILIGGTSLSCPLFAGIVSLVDQVRLNNNLTKLSRQHIVGMMNTQKIGDYTIDVEFGESDRDVKDPTDPSEPRKYKALSGYDVPTGLGAPLLCNWIKLLAVDSGNMSTNNSDLPSNKILIGDFLDNTKKKKDGENGTRNKKMRDKSSDANKKKIVEYVPDAQKNVDSISNNYKSINKDSYFNSRKKIWPSNVLTPSSIKNAYDIPLLPVTPKASRTKIGIVSAGFNTNIQNELNMWCNEFGYTSRNITVLNMGRTTLQNIWSMELSQSVQSVYAINPNADIVVVCSVDLSTANYTRAIEQVCKMNCKLVKLNLGAGLAETNVFESIFSKYPDVLFVSGCGDSVLTYPSTSQYVLSVGSTQIIFGANNLKQSEVASPAVRGVGMTRSRYVKPAYQKRIAALNQFLFKCCPEVCAAGSQLNGFPVYNVQSNTPDKWSLQFGTSLSASIIVGLVSLVNQSRNNALSLIRPIISNLGVELKLSDLYRLFSEDNAPSYFYDIISGQVNDTRTNPNITHISRRGYDVATGFGVPNIKRWIEYFAQLYVDARDIIKIYDIPEIQIGPARRKPVIGIVTTHFNNRIQLELDEYCRQMKYPLSKISVINLGNPFGATEALPSNYNNIINETSMNVQAIYSMNPNCNIVVVNARDTLNLSLLEAIDRACREDCEIVKLNFSVQENNSNVQMFDNIFRRYGTVLFIAGVGDMVLQYPASSNNVLSVGRTNLYVDSLTKRRMRETSYTSQGCGDAVVSSFKPKYQKKIASLNRFNNKVCPELSANGGEYSGFLTFNNTSKWTIQTGCSLSASIIAAMFSIINYALAKKKQRPLTPGDLYSMFESEENMSLYFFDIKSGFVQDQRSGKGNVYSCSDGYDVPSGFGVLNVKKMIEYFSKNNCPLIKRDPII